ncbi:MAG: dienelactone hydrolase family protein [Gammaproteobacteria bacterium]
MAFREQLIEYRSDDTLLEGFFCFDDELPGPLPTVIISHDWSGRGEFVEKKAHRLAYHGYAVFALDMYGKGKRGTTQEECQALMMPLVTDRALLAKRINAALTQVKTLPQVDSRRIAAMGYCFGGLCALDLARSGAEVRGVVSIHGILKPNGLPPVPRIPAKVLVLHGYDDPMAPPEDVLAIGKELTQGGSDWQLHAYGGTLHAFTNPNANNPAGGMLYSEKAHRRSWHSLTAFLDEVLR